MKNQEFLRLLGAIALAVVLVVWHVSAQAEMYVEGYIGGAAAANFTSSESHINAGISPSVIGGVKVGTWFVKEGFAGFNYPDWMKYLGFYTDFSYQNLFLPKQTVVSSAPFNVDFHSEGMVATWAFMFAGRYGFFPDSEVPFGRLQPYLAVGPAVMFSSRDLKIITQGPKVFTGLSLGSTSSTNIALAVDTGIRYMMLKNVSLDVSFRYRLAAPRFKYDSVMDWNPTYNLFSGQVGVAYHF